MTKQYLTEAEEQFVRKAGTERHWANLQNQDRPDYDHKRFNLTSLQASRLGVYAEAVTFKYLGGDILNHDLWDWPSFVPNDHPDYHELLHRGDLWGRIEVRRANSRHSPIPSFGKDRELGADIIQVLVPYSQPQPTKENPLPGIKVHGYGELLGWASTADAGTVPDWNKTDALVHQRRPMETFGVNVNG